MDQSADSITDLKTNTRVGPGFLSLFSTHHQSVQLTVLSGVKLTVCGWLGLSQTGHAHIACQTSPAVYLVEPVVSVSALRLTGGVAGRFGHLQVGGRSHLLIVPPHSPDVEQLALLHHDEAEHDQHDPAHCGEEADQHPLYDGLVELAGLLPGDGGRVEVVGGGDAGVVPLQPRVAPTLIIRLSSRLALRLKAGMVRVGNFKTEVRP